MPSQNVRLSAAAWVPATRSVLLGGASWCRIIALGIGLIAAAHVTLFGYFLFRTAISSPISDMFAYIDVYLQFRAEKISLLDYLWRAHGEHHLVWIRLLTWADVAIFHTRGIPFMVAASAAIWATAVIICQQLLRAEPRLGSATWLALLAPMMILSTANVIDCSVPINTTYPFTVFFVVLTLVLFPGAGEINFNTQFRRIAALLAAFGASMGTAAGLLAWPILFWIAWRERLNLSYLATLAALGIVYILLYAQGLNLFGVAVGLKEGPAAFVGVTHLVKLSDYFFSVLGLPFTREPDLEQIGRIIGAMLFSAGLFAVLIATVSDRLNTRMDRIAIGMILLAFGSAALAAVGRADLIDGNHVPVRYTMFATSLQVGLLCIVLPRAVRYDETPRFKVVQSSASLLLALLLLIIQVFIGRAAERIADVISRDADCFAQGAQAGSVSRVVTKWPDDAEKVLTALRQQGLLAPRSMDCTARPAS
jgi:hypothetical protein